MYWVADLRCYRDTVLKTIDNGVLFAGCVTKAASCQWNCVPLSCLSTITTRFSRSCLSVPLGIRTKKQRVPGVDYY